MKTPSHEHARPAWVAPMYQALGLRAEACVAEVFEQADRVASGLAPNTRRLWRWILMLEGVAVLLPLLWLMVVRLTWHPGYTAFAVLTCTLLIVGVCWWLRWRGMQHTWVRARLLAEIARSARTTGWLPGRATVAALASAPRLQALAVEMPHDFAHEAEMDLETLKSRYLKERILDQKEHYTKKRLTANQERKQLSRLVTRSLDGALFLAVAGVALVVTGNAEHVLSVSGSDYVLGLAGTALPLVAILMQSLSSYLELNRRTGRYAQQIDFLDAAEVRMLAVTSMEEALRVVHEVENGLLGEVVEWFYQAEHAEFFYHPKNVDEAGTIHAAVQQARAGWLQRLLHGLTAGMGFIMSVILGRLVVVAVAIVATAAAIGYWDAHSRRHNSEFRVCDGCLLSKADASSWIPKPERTARGLILIAHGLKDGANLPSDDVKWMSRMQTMIETDLQAAAPEVCLVDWNKAAGNPTMSPDLISSAGAIRPQAVEIGKLVGCKLAMAIKDGTLHADQPMHFIGHSAGGFVVMSAAHTLHLLGIKLKNLHLTILDTPLPDLDAKADLARIVDHAAIDYYLTSIYAQRVPKPDFHRNLKVFDLNENFEHGWFNSGHSYAYEWFIKSIDDKDERGFVRSPFKQRAAAATETPAGPGR